MGSRQLKDFDMLLCAMDSFIRGNSNFESSMVINSAITELEQCNSIQQCFSIPLQHKLFNMDSALKWVLFLSIIPEKIIEQFAEDEDFSEMKDDFNEFSKFSESLSLKLIASVYDIGLQEHVLSHLDEDSGDEDSGDGDSGDEDSGDDDSDDGDSNNEDSNNEDSGNDDLDNKDLVELDIKSLALEKRKKNKN
jgi:hypothetical protein